MKRVFLSLSVLFGTAVGFVAAAGQTVPALKPGLWEMHAQSSAGGANTALPTTVCVGAMPDQERQAEQDNIKNRCSKYESRQVGAEWVVDAVCSARGRTVTKHTVTSLSGDRFREEDTAPQGSMTSDGKWLSACKPGQKPELLK